MDRVNGIVNDMSENLNITEIPAYTLNKFQSESRYKCNGCGERFSKQGIRVHQNHRYAQWACRPVSA